MLALETTTDRPYYMSKRDGRVMCDHSRMMRLLARPMGLSGRFLAMCTGAVVGPFSHFGRHRGHHMGPQGCHQAGFGDPFGFHFGTFSVPKWHQDP